MERKKKRYENLMLIWNVWWWIMAIRRLKPGNCTRNKLKLLNVSICQVAHLYQSEFLLCIRAAFHSKLAWTSTNSFGTVEISSVPTSEFVNSQATCSVRKSSNYRCLSTVISLVAVKRLPSYLSLETLNFPNEKVKRFHFYLFVCSFYPMY